MKTIGSSNINVCRGPRVIRNFIVPVLLTLVACLGHRVDLIQAKRVSVETQAPDKYRISASVYEQEGTLRLLGRVEQSPFALPKVMGHVDVEIRDPQGNTSRSLARLNSVSAARHMSRPASFAATFPVVPPDGSKVMVSYNPKSHEH